MNQEKFIPQTDATKTFSKENYFRNYILKLISVISFILITELCFALLVYRDLSRQHDEIYTNFVPKKDIDNYILTVIKSNEISEQFVAEILSKINKRDATLFRKKRDNVSVISFYKIKYLVSKFLQFYFQVYPKGAPKVPCTQSSPSLRGLPGEKGEKGSPGELSPPGMPCPCVANIAELRQEIGEK